MKQKMYLQEERPKFLSFLEMLTAVFTAAVFGLFLAKTMFLSAKTVSRSMEPTIDSGTVVFIDRLSGTFRETERFQVVAFRRKDTSDVLIRRVIGLPGETVRIYRGVVYIDGEALDVSGYLSEITSDGIASEGIRLGEGEYFLLGDMPANSEDSRSSTIGVVRESQIIGRVWIAFRSVTEFRFIH